MLSWDEAAGVYADAVREYHVTRGRAADEPSVLSTIRTNGELVPRRAENLLAMIAAWSDRPSLDRCRVLEVGSGFGALAAYLAWSADAQRIVGVDIRRDFVDTASECARRLGIDDRVRYVQSDMRALQRLGDDRFDVLIANNAFIYLPSAKDMDRALREFHARLAPGGWAVFYHANRWTWRDPFTGAPVVHLLPPGLARAVTRLTGRRHSHDRVRLLAPWELAWRLRRAGFRDIRIGGFDRRGLTSGGHLRRFYGTVAQRPRSSA